jgi:uroporphyrinogen decarboxylase
LIEKVTSRERVLTALHHKTPDRVPIDFGGTENSSIIKEGYDKLIQHIGFEPNKIAFLDMMMRSVKVAEEIQEYFETDFRGVFPSRTLPIKWINDYTYIDQWGIKWIKKENIFYYEQVNYPLAGDISIKDILHYNWPNPDEIVINEELNNMAKKMREETDKALVLSLPAPIIHTTQYLRGFEDWYMDCAGNVKLLETLFDKVLEINMVIAEKILKQAAKHVDIIKMADDIGMQTGLQVSPDFFRKFIKPRFKKYTDLIRRFAPDTIIHIHSCGSIEAILKDFIEIGINVINPVQVSAKNMDPKTLKSKYGNDLSFWGAIDTQSVLNRMNEAEVKKEVEKTIDILGEGGGYILSAVHNIQPDVPPENIVAMFEHAKKYKC